MKNRKVDKGFELNYYNLSYRRKFIRTLWMIPWLILAICGMCLVKAPIFIIIPVAVILVIILFIQAVHNYKKWKEDIDKS